MIETVDPRVVAALAAGQPDRALDAVRSEAGPLVEALVDAEVGLRRGVNTVADVIGLAEQVVSQNPDVPVAQWWASALVADQCGLSLDIAGARLATTVLADIPDEPVLPVLVLWIRGRLRRIAGLMELFGPEPDRTTHRRLCSQAVADFTRCGFTEEVAVTRLLAAVGRVLWLWEDHHENVAIVLDARSMVGPDSEWGAYLDMVGAVMALVIEDLPLAGRFVAALSREPHPSPGAQAYSAAVRALHELVNGAGEAGRVGFSTTTTAQALAASTAQLSTTDPLGSYRMRLLVAAALAHLGQGALAHTVALPVLDMPALNPIDELGREVLVLRCRLQTGEHIPLAALSEMLDRCAALGQPGRVPAWAEILARDLRRAGRAADAAALLAHRLVADGTGATSATDARRSADDLAGPPAHDGVGLVQVRIMAPTVTVEVEGRMHDLRTMPARLLLALLVSHPAPLVAEAAAAALWPDSPWDTDRRRRLNVVVHRLRQSLGDAGSAVVRSRDMLVLDADGWDVDLFRVRRVLRQPSSDDLLAVLTGLTGNLAHAQFPYDEALVDERHTLLAAIFHSLALGDGGTDPDPELVEVLRTLGGP